VLIHQRSFKKLGTWGYYFLENPIIWIVHNTTKQPVSHKFLVGARNPIFEKIGDRLPPVLVAHR